MLRGGHNKDKKEMRGDSGAAALEGKTTDSEAARETSSRDIGMKPPFFTGWERSIAMTQKERPSEKKGSEPRKNRRELDTPRGTITIENYFPADELEKLEIEDGIKMFSRHQPARQKQALLNVARSENGNVISAVKDGTLVAYIGIHYPSEKERWGKPDYKWLFEFGAIEVSDNYREVGLADGMLSIAFDDPSYEDKIMFTTGFTWHWDLEGTGLRKMEYHDLGVRLFGKYGFMEMATDEPNISMDPANLFMARIGRDASFSRYQKFATLLFANEWEAMLRGS